MGPKSNLSLPPKSLPKTSLIRPGSLFADKKADLSGIRVYQTMKSIAERDGEVLDARQQAVKIAWETPGVQSVVKNL
jgi:osmotically-inducible protein OsmY